MLELLKIRKDINWLIDKVKCLIRNKDLASPLSATEWSPNHRVSTGNPYLKDSFVWLEGDIYKSLVDNNIYPPTNEEYWEKLGEGHLLLEEQSDWDATTGRPFIRNKPTKTSDFINDGEDGVNPFITTQGEFEFTPSDYDLEDFTNSSVNPFAKISDLSTYSDFIEDSITNGVVNKAPTENAVYDALQLKQNTIGYTPVNKAGDTMLGNLTLKQDPTTALQAATKQYVDTIALGINFHAPVRVATTGNIEAIYDNGMSGVIASLVSLVPGSIEIDDVLLQQGDRILVWQQTNPIENGIYQVIEEGNIGDPFILARALDADNSPVGEIVSGDYVLALEGYSKGGYGFICNTPGTIIIGTTGINFVQFNAAQAVTAGYGLLELVANVISINPDETQEKITLTTTGSSGEATFVGNTLNIPQYSGATDLGYTPSPTNGIVTSNTGDDATIPLADATNAGLLKPAKFTVLENTTGSNSGDETTSTIKTKLGITTLSGVNTGDQNLQQVTAKGALTTVPISINVYNDTESVIGLVVASDDITGSSTGANIEGTGFGLIVGGPEAITVYDSNVGVAIVNAGSVAFTTYIQSGDAAIFNLGTYARGLVVYSGASSVGNPIEILKEEDVKLVVNQEGELTATKIIKQGGLPNQFLMADGSTSGIEVAQQSLSGTGMTATGGTLPTGINTHFYRWSQVGNLVTVRINLQFQTANTCSGIAIPFANMPDIPQIPQHPGIYSVIGDIITYGSGSLSSTKAFPTFTVGSGTSGIRIKTIGTPNTYEFVIGRASGSYNNGWAHIQYYI